MERSDEHLCFFEEGVEAEFFNTKEEMFRKVAYYLNDSEKRESIARSGRQRCIKSLYSFDDVVERMLNSINGVRNND
jgi:spore maturation protein CgeB